MFGGRGRVEEDLVDHWKNKWVGKMNLIKIQVRKKSFNKGTSHPHMNEAGPQKAMDHGSPVGSVESTLESLGAGRGHEKHLNICRVSIPGSYLKMLSHKIL